MKNVDKLDGWEEGSNRLFTREVLWEKNEERETTLYVNFLKQNKEISLVTPRNKYCESARILEGCYEK